MMSVALAGLAQMPPRFFFFSFSGGAGALGKHVARIALSQFTGLTPQMIVIPQVCSREQVAEAIAQVAARRGIIIHTMVDPHIRQEIIQLAQEYQIGLTQLRACVPFLLAESHIRRRLDQSEIAGRQGE